MLSGQTALIVEAQYLIALDLQITLEDLGVDKVVIAQNPAHAREMAQDWADCSVAIVEVERELPEHLALIGELLRRNIHVIGLTADSDLPLNLNWLATTPILLKPASSESVVKALSDLLAAQNE